MKKLFILLVLSSILPLCAMKLPVERGKGGARRVSFNEVIDVRVFDENEPPLELLKVYDSASETDEDDEDGSSDPEVWEQLSSADEEEEGDALLEPDAEAERFEALWDRLEELKSNRVNVERLRSALLDPDTDLSEVEVMIAKLENEFVQPSGATSYVAWPRNDEKDSDGSSSDDDVLPRWAMKRDNAALEEEDEGDGEFEVAAADGNEYEEDGWGASGDEEVEDESTDETAGALSEEEGPPAPAPSPDVPFGEKVAEKAGNAPTSSGWLKRAVQPHVLGKVAGVTFGVFVIGGLTHRHIEKQRALDKPTVFDRMRQWIQRRYRGLVRGEKKQV